MSPYRARITREPRPKRSTLRRLRAAGDRSHSLYPLTWRRLVRHLAAYGIAAFFLAPVMLLVPEAWTAWIRWPLVFMAGVFAWAITDTLLGLWRLQVARKTMRRWSTRCLHRDDGCHACGGTATTFPRIAAYRELARTGDVEAFAAKDKRPVTVEYTLQAMDDGEEPRRDRS